jgi:hypothetical protein
MCLSVQKAVRILETKPWQLPHYPVLLRSEVGQEMSVSIQNVFFLKFVTQRQIVLSGSLPSTRRKGDAKWTLCVYRRPAIFYRKPSTIKARCPDHAVVYSENGPYTAIRQRAPHHCTCSHHYALPIRSYAPPKSGSSSCRTLYFEFYQVHWQIRYGSRSIYIIGICWEYAILCVDNTLCVV